MDTFVKIVNVLRLKNLHITSVKEPGKHSCELSKNYIENEAYNESIYKASY